MEREVYLVTDLKIIAGALKVVQTDGVCGACSTFEALPRLIKKKNPLHKPVAKMQQMAVTYKGNMILCLSRDYPQHTDFTLPYTDWLA